jgi:hypothetical protein
MDGESENPVKSERGEFAVSGKRPFFWLLFFGRYQRKVTRLRRKRLIEKERNSVARGGALV